MNTITFEDCIARMSTLGDEDIQIQEVIQFIKTLRIKKKKCPTLAGKVAYEQAIREAESVLRKLRLNIFEIQDMLVARKQLAAHPSPSDSTQG